MVGIESQIQKDAPMLAIFPLLSLFVASPAHAVDVITNYLDGGDGYHYASIDDAPVFGDYGTWDNDCQTDPQSIPIGWELAVDEPGIDAIIFSGGWSTHCMFAGDCSYGTYNYGLGGCGCGYYDNDGDNWWVTSCSRRMLVRRAAEPPVVVEPALAVSGDCPGTVNLDFSGFTPGGNVTLLFSRGVGADLVPGGRCRGVETGLSPARWALTMPDLDEDGLMSFSPTVPEAACGMNLQVLDPESCALSDVMQVP